MPKFKDHTGERFGILTAIKYEIRETKHGKVAYWYCKCDCGTEKWVSANNLTMGNAKSCGCKQYDTPQTKPNPLKRDNPRIYSIWTGMKTRCLNPNSERYMDYGGRGITICEEWLEFDNFCLWSLENGYADGMTIDRIDNDMPYCPDNCRWTTIEEQNKNKRNLRMYTYNGETRHLAEWARVLNIDYQLLYDRLDLGMSFEKAVTYTPRRYERVPSITSEDDERTARNKRDYQRFIIKCDDSLSETKIAKAIGIGLSSLQKWKNGKCHPTTEHMQKIIKYIGANEDYFEIV